MWKLGFDLTPFTVKSNATARRKFLLNQYAIDTVLDVGASNGRYGFALREVMNYRGRIVSFEPMQAPFAELNARASNDSQWTALNYALGESNEDSSINVAANSSSSSILGMLPAHEQAKPSSAYVKREQIQIRTLDSVFDEICGTARSIYMKLDTQGFEEAILRGAKHSLDRINTIQLEMSIVPLYEDTTLFAGMVELMQEKGYMLVGLESGFVDKKTGQLMQIDGIFRRVRP